MKDDKLVYEPPIEIYKYPDYKGYLYNISNTMIDLDVTIGHRMYVKHDNDNGFNLIEASKIRGKQIRYKKDSLWNDIDYQLIIPNNNKPVNMEAWLSLYIISFPYLSIPDISNTADISSTVQSLYGVESPKAPI